MQVVAMLFVDDLFCDLLLSSMQIRDNVAFVETVVDNSREKKMECVSV